MAKAKSSKSKSLTTVDKQLAEEAKEMAERIGAPAANVIQVKQNKTFVLPDGRSTEGPLAVVILDFVYRNLMFEGAYDPDNIQPPICFAISQSSKNMVPSENSIKRQNEDCNSCPNNAFGSAGKGKACKNTVLLAVLPSDATDETPIYTISVSPTAIRAFDAYVNTIAANFQKPPIGVVTELYFDPGSDYPSLRFGRPAPNPDYAQHFARRDEARNILLTEPDMTGYEDNKPKAKSKAKSTRSRRRT